MNITTHCLGLPRIGARRELKFALENYWNGRSNSKELENVAQELESLRRAWQRNAGLDLVTIGDFSLYDHVLETSLLLGNIPPRFENRQDDPLNLCLRLGRGRAQPDEPGTEPCEMTKWFDTNYHYLVPEFLPDTQFSVGNPAWFHRIEQAVAEGHALKVSLLGPVSYLYLGKEKTAGFSRLTLLPKILPVYARILDRLKALGISWVQIDEPVLSLDLDSTWLGAFESAYHILQRRDLNVLLTTGFGALQENLHLACHLPVNGLHLDSVRSNEAWTALDWLADYRVLSLGVIDGRNIWRADQQKLTDRVRPLYDRLGDRLWLGSAGSLLHVPVQLAEETALSASLLPRLSFAREKLEEIAGLKALLQDPESATAKSILLLSNQAKALGPRPHSVEITSASVAERSTFASRYAVQQKNLGLPLLPTTTIGSFPQTEEIRRARADHRSGKISDHEYTAFLEREIALTVREQETLGLDVLVHGESERNDMVEYFAELLDGYAVTRFGWVQSYGSRCVKPPIIHDDVSRPAAMTVRWTAHAQSLTTRPVKGMLTGPVTMLGWSFVREDIPRPVVALQIADALNREVRDLERFGIRIIQIDEPAFREGLPLRRSAQQDYWHWAVQAFRRSYAGVRDETQIHTHMCYSEFNDCLPVLAEMDADVITIETARSDMELLNAFSNESYPNAIGPGIYDIHAPIIPELATLRKRIEAALEKVSLKNLWINPDCGLKTRNWQETRAALGNMVEAVRLARAELPTRDADNESTPEENAA